MNSVCKQFCSASASAASRCRASARIAKQVHLATQGDVCTRMLSSSLFIQSSSSVRWQAERSLQSQPSSSLLSLQARSKASAVLKTLGLPPLQPAELAVQSLLKRLRIADGLPTVKPSRVCPRI
jgi:hypothetical protein